MTLNWSTVRAENVLLDGNPVQGPDGSIQVSPGQTAVFLLTAESALGRVEMPLTVTVVEAPPTPAMIRFWILDCRGLGGADC